MKFMKIVSTITLLVYIVFGTSSKYNIEKIPWKISEASLFNQQFYIAKVETLYQCMELCSQFSICKSLWAEPGNCELYKVLKEHAYKLGSSGQYYEASWIPKSISGACTNHTCSRDKQCVPKHVNDYVCIPHKFPTFTCEDGWLYSARKCHFIYAKFDDRMPWQEAKNYCTNLKSNLTEIQTVEEHTFLHDLYYYITDWNIEPNETAFYWTSLQYVSEYKTWIWKDSGRIQNALSFSYWFPYYQQLIRPDQDNCMVVSKNTSYHWSVADCSTNGVFICERLMV